MRTALSRAFHLARSLPTFPLSQYEAEVTELGDTEVERIVKERVGQGFFRRALLDYWGNCCPLTGIREEALLRASHIVPWAKCRSDDERLDVFNGLLLAAHWDAAFDRGLVSFDDDGKVLVKSCLDSAVTRLLAPESVKSIPLETLHRRNLAWHRQEYDFD
jgi:predicted restriction endonuclease